MRSAETAAAQAVVLWTKGTVQYAPAGTFDWSDAPTNQTLYPGDQVRTGERSRAMLQLRDRSMLPVAELTTLRLVERPRGLGLQMLRGLISFFHRDRLGEIEVEGGGVNATIRGTEFVFGVSENGEVQVTLYDGKLELANAQGTLNLVSGESAEARPGEAPRRTAVILSGDLTAIQWALYYPAILDLDELDWSAPEEAAVQRSVAEYRAGNLPRALAEYPSKREPATPEEQLYLAALLLSVGNVAEAERHLERASGREKLAGLVAAHRELIAAVQRRVAGTNPAAAPKTATAWLARSYARQSASKLEESRAAARQAAAMAPKFGFAWTRWAETEFSFGRVREAEKALDSALAMMPQNAEAVALHGFVLAARNRIDEARGEFERALVLDGALGNAWLGRGLCRIRQGDLAGGRADLQAAAAVEPQRAVLRSYLGKGFFEERRAELAWHELELARQLDPLDPTPWLYGSLLAREQNRINDAVRDLDRAQALNDNRAVFRSRLLLDQDRAVSAANQSEALREAGLIAPAVETASKAVASDYANASAHQLLADSFASPERINLRYETPRASEYLMANLLSPVGGGLLSPTVTQGEYSRLFERDRLRVFSRADYLSRGAWTQSGAVAGVFGGTGFLAEAYYDTDPGVHSNTDLEHTAFSLQLKQQVGDRDTFYAQALHSEFQSGDIAHYLQPLARDPDLRITEEFEPIFVAGWHRAWTPGSHTLVLAGVLNGEQTVTDPTQPMLGVELSPGTAPAAYPFHIEQQYRNRTRLFTLEAQQIFETGSHLWVAGGRLQHGHLEAWNEHGANDGYNPFVLPGSAQRVSPEFRRAQLYLYDRWQLVPSFAVTAGLSLDHVESPANFRFAPLGGEEEIDRSALSPKAGFVWQLPKSTWLRGGYTRSLGGGSFDQSFRLEPTQVAGFNQAFRSLIPESVVGAQSVPEFETWHLSLETRLGSNTWASVGGEYLTSDARRQVGAYAGDPGVFMAPVAVDQSLEYREAAFSANLSQLMGPWFSLAGRYRLSRTELEQRFPAYPNVTLAAEEEALLHELRVALHFNHESGWFATAEGLWLNQLDEASSPWPDEELWQMNLYAGYRFWRRHAEISVALLNATDQDYRLHPLSYRVLLERERTLAARFRWNF